MRHKHSHNGRQKAIGALDRLLSEPKELEYVLEQLREWLHDDFRELYRHVLIPLYVEPEVLPAEEEFATLSPDEQVREMMRLTIGRDKPNVEAEDKLQPGDKIASGGNDTQRTITKEPTEPETEV